MAGLPGTSPATASTTLSRMPDAVPLSAEDNKLVTLARATKARTRAAEGAAVRDTDGRTYAAATVALPSLQVSAIGVCIAMALSSGSQGLEAVVLLTEGDGLADADRAAVADFAGGGVPVLVGDARGNVQEQLSS